MIKQKGEMSCKIIFTFSVGESSPEAPHEVAGPNTGKYGRNFVQVDRYIQ